jgi:hypothetical protein
MSLETTRRSLFWLLCDKGFRARTQRSRILSQKSVASKFLDSRHFYLQEKDPTRILEARDPSLQQSARTCGLDSSLPGRVDAETDQKLLYTLDHDGSMQLLLRFASTRVPVCMIWLSLPSRFSLRCAQGANCRIIDGRKEREECAMWLARQWFDDLGGLA